MRLWLSITLVAAILLAFVALAYLRRLRWTGIPEVRDGDTVVRPAKTLWDWLQLFVIPVALAGLAFLLNDSQARRDRAIAADGRREAALDTYAKEMSGLLLAHRLEPRKDTVAAAVARTITLTTSRRLNGERRGLLVKFLVDAGLLDGVTGGLVGDSCFGATVDMDDADLREATLADTVLASEDLARTNLQRADLSGADLDQSCLAATNLRSADLRHASLRNTMLWLANLRYARLQHADLRGAILYCADLRNAHFEGADLRFAQLELADVRGGHFQHARLTDTERDALRKDDRPRRGCPGRPPHQPIVAAGTELQAATRASPRSSGGLGSP
jgi:hypothetical protein